MAETPDHSQEQPRPVTVRRESGLYRLPFRGRPESRPKEQDEDTFATPKPITNRPKRFPESLHFNPSNFRLRSPTASSISSISSMNVPDSATTRSISTLASPISTSYAGEVQDLFALHSLDLSSRPSSRFRHRHKASTGTCSTLVNDDDDGQVITGYPDFATKLRRLGAISPELHQVDETEPSSPSTEAPIKEELDSPSPMQSLVQSPERTPTEPSEEVHDDAQEEWEESSCASDDFSPEDGQSILDFTLQLIYGVELRETSISPATTQQLVQKFIRDVGQHVWQTPSDTQNSKTTSSSSSSSTPGGTNSNGGSQRGGKRKKAGKAGEDGDEYSDGEGSGVVPVKRTKPNPKEEENLRLSCPFRKRNPLRFNVRDHYSCAMTYFPKFAELRQHIVKQHKRDDPSAFVCDRCNRHFCSRKELRDHQRLPKEQMCDISDHDPESGIDGPTSNKLLSRKRASGSSAEVQWREIWNILFPDDEDNFVKPYSFVPVIEHFELANNFLASFRHLNVTLRDKISNPATLETLATKFHQCFVETVERCIAESTNMPYTNRSNKKNEPTRVQTSRDPVPRKGRELQPRPDSGVVIDDESEESGSMSGTGMAQTDVKTVVGPVGTTYVAGHGNLREVLPAPPADSHIFDEALMRHFAGAPLSLETGPMDPSTVQAWTNSVIYNPTDASISLADHFGGSAALTPQTEFAAWGDSMYPPGTFTGMGDHFTHFGDSTNPSS